MVAESLDEIKLAFDAWRRSKKIRREPMPEVLVARARRAASVHGVGAVVKATKISYERLRSTNRTGKNKAAAAVAPSYSRVEVLAPASPVHPLVEIEMTSGMKLRAFVLSPETLGLLSSLCAAGGAT